MGSGTALAKNNASPVALLFERARRVQNLLASAELYRLELSTHWPVSPACHFDFLRAALS